MQELFKSIKGMLLDNADIASTFTEIMQGFQAPTKNKFISYVILHTVKTGLTGVLQYDPPNVTNIMLYENLVQVDFYSDDPYSAPDAADTFHNYLTGFSSEFLNNNFVGFTMGVIDDVLNHSEVGDKGKYLYRYTQRFTMFTHNLYTRPEQFIDAINVIPKLVN